MNNRVYNKMDKFPKRHLIIYLFTICWDILCWLIVLILWVLGGKRLEWVNGLWVIVGSDSILKKTVFKGYNGGAVGHGGWIAEQVAGEKGIDTSTEFHEHVHVEQYEVIMLLIGIINILYMGFLYFKGDVRGALLFAMLIQVLGGVIGITSGFLTAWLRGEDTYRGTAHEEAAYAREEISSH